MAPRPWPKNWIFLRGLAREQRHWGEFPALWRGRFPQTKLHTPDLRGNGSRRLEPSPWRVDGELADLRSGRASEPLGCVAISMGAMVAMKWAEVFPGELSHLVCINSSDRRSPFYDRLQPRQYPRVLRALLSARTNEELELLVLRMTTQLLKNPRDQASRQSQLPLPTTANFLRQLVAASRFLQSEQKPACEVLFLASARDELVNPRCSRRLASRWQAPLEIHPRAGHDLPLDDPSWILDHITRAWVP